MGDSKISYIAALDVGTTTIRCQIINSRAEVVSSAHTGVNLIYPQADFVEIDPDEFWNSIVLIIKEAIKDSNLQPSEINSLGISTQRSTFITWRKDTGEPFHNFITWKDMRAKSLVKYWNESILFKGFRTAAYMVYLFTRKKRYLMGSGLNITTTHASGRLAWVLENVPEIQANIKKNNVCFGTVDTWLMHKFTKGKRYITDVTNVSSTGLFDPFIMDWSDWPKQLLKIPTTIFPQVVDSDYDFGATEPEILGAPIPIKSLMADQQASMFGSCCFKKNDVKITLGTGSFIDMNTDNSAHASLDGIYPLVAWRFKNDTAYIAEAACSDTGTLIQWALNIGLVNNPVETSELARQLPDSDGVYFVPAFSGLGPPICDDKAATGFFGIKPTSSKAHMTRAILESIVYRVILAFNVLKRETGVEYERICVDGGVSKNDFVCQLLADMSGSAVVRLSTAEMSILGAALAAGLNSGVWKDKEEMCKLRKVDRTFLPNNDPQTQRAQTSAFNEWMEVVERFRSWY